ncbi:keratin, type II cytoskeletal 2 epidermal-like isoform X4 [Diaphorina citri]|uniref:Keratin, type II cytoskeletal 2 epidermal-like isoform X4 n=1 Tax=Diaphorina citri TaxID=121845 RepID=A0A3Q0IY66_DIACI|nr:keratin, type II cytoskeletal 2 epidermal-like isoform X4 [Diaphorina citri]
MTVVLTVVALLGSGLSMPNGKWEGNQWQEGSLMSSRFRREASGFGNGGQGGFGGGQGGFGGGQGRFGGGQGGFGGGSGGYGIKNWYNTPEGWGYDATYPGGETHFHSKRGGGGQRGGFGGGSY